MATLQSNNRPLKEVRQSLDSDRDPKYSGHIMGQWFKEHCLPSPHLACDRADKDKLPGQATPHV